MDSFTELFAKLTIRDLEPQYKERSAIKIQLWWKLRHGVATLRAVKHYIASSLCDDAKQSLVDRCAAIRAKCKGDGAGLTGGTLVDIYIGELFADIMERYEPFRTGESDMKICDVPLSQKKIHGKSQIALDWSKNPGDTSRPPFSSHILIINLCTQQWWKTQPKRPYRIEITRVVESGLYLVDREFCRRRVRLSANNKTNTLISSVELYAMLMRSVETELWIPIPPESATIPVFRISGAFMAPGPT